MTTTASESITVESFDLLDWINTGTVARRQVPLYIDHDAYAEVKRLCEELEELGWTAEQAAEDARRAPQDGPLSGSVDAYRTEQMRALEAELESWSARLDASRMLWTVRAVSEDEVRASFDAIPVPKAPLPPKDGAAQAIQERWMERVSEFNRAKAAAEEERKLHLIAAAVTCVETVKGARDVVTIDELRALRSRPHGGQWIERLYKAIGEATDENAEPPVPTSPARSTSTRG